MFNTAFNKFIQLPESRNNFREVNPWTTSRKFFLLSGSSFGELNFTKNLLNTY
jgi:hypothetical protein